MAVVDQPPPAPRTDRRLAWEEVIAYVTRRRTEIFLNSPVADLLIADMRARDQVGREHYGTALTSGNGRDHLVDAFQEQLDACAYLVNELDEHGVGPSTLITIGLIEDPKLRWRLMTVQQLFTDQVRAAFILRSIIEERVS